MSVFAQEHKHGLVFCLRLKEGVEKAVEMSVLAKYMQHFWDKALGNHFDLEESLLLAAVDQEHALSLQFKAEHKKIRDLAAKISVSNDAKDYDLVVELSDLLFSHIRFEAGDFFPFVEQSLSADELQKVGAELKKEEAFEESFDAPFWQS